MLFAIALEVASGSAGGPCLDGVRFHDCLELSAINIMLKLLSLFDVFASSSVTSRTHLSVIFQVLCHVVL